MRNIGLPVWFLSKVLRSDPVTMPILPEISCNITVAMIERANAQINEKPKFAPASVHTVTVPGPMKAAAINGPGPIFRNGFLIVKWENFRKIEN